MINVTLEGKTNMIFRHIHTAEEALDPNQPL